MPAKPADGGASSGENAASGAFLVMMRTQDDVVSQVATYLSLSDLFHVIQSCRTATHSAFRHQALRATRLEIPPDEPRAAALIAGMDPATQASVKHVDVADMHSVELLDGVFTGLRSLRLRHHRYLLRHTPYLELRSLRSFPQLATLDLSHVPDLEDLTGIEALAPSLLHLNLAHTGVEDITPLYSLSQLQELILYNTPVYSIAPVSAMAQLRAVDVSYTRNLENLKPLLALTRLKKLVMNHKSIVKLDTLTKLAGNLEHLEIMEANVQSLANDDREAFVSALINVEHLDLSWSRFLSRLEPLAPLKKLRVLNLSGLKYADLSPLSALTTLEELYVKQDVDVDFSVVGTLRNLRKLYVYGFRPHTGSVQFLGNLPHLEVLDVSSLFRLGMPELSQLKTLGVKVLSYSEYFKYPQAPQLTELKVHSRVDVNQFLARFSNLRHLHLEDIDRVGLQSLAQFTQLESLEIGRSNSLQQPLPEDHSFLRPLKQLRVLRVRYTPLSDLFILTGMKKLAELSLEGTAVTDVWHLTALEELQVLSVLDTKVRNVADLTVLKKLRKITLPKNAGCTPLLDAFHTGSALDALKEVWHPTQNCLWGQHRSSN